MGLFNKKELRFNRVFLIILDSIGVGQVNLDDKLRQDGVNTFKHISENTEHEYKNFAKLGIFNLISENNFPAMTYHTKAAPLNTTNDNIGGYFEILGTLSSFDKTLLDSLISKNYNVYTLGNISNIFRDKGTSFSGEMTDNTYGIRSIMRALHNDFKGLFLANFHDFNNYGINKDVIGFGNSLRELDEAIPHFLSHLNDKDLLIITGSHGCDPTFDGNTREKIPVFIYSSAFRNPNKIPEFKTLGNIGALIADNFGVKKTKVGESILDTLK